MKKLNLIEIVKSIVKGAYDEVYPFLPKEFQAISRTTIGAVKGGMQEIERQTDSQEVERQTDPQKIMLDIVEQMLSKDKKMPDYCSGAAFEADTFPNEFKAAFSAVFNSVSAGEAEISLDDDDPDSDLAFALDGFSEFYFGTIGQKTYLILEYSDADSLPPFSQEVVDEMKELKEALNTFASQHNSGQPFKDFYLF